jgi:hypothetical protein
LTTTTNHPVIFKSKVVQSALLGHQTDPETAWDAPGVQEKWKTCVTDLSGSRGVADTMKAIESHVKDNKKTYGHTKILAYAQLHGRRTP